MSKLFQMIEDKQQADAEWKENKKAEREQVNEMAADGIIAITEDPEVYLSFLDLQAANPSLSAGNLALVISQRPESTRLASRERWHKLERAVKKDEAGVKVLMPERYQRDGETRTGYKIGLLFDVTQTSGKALPPPLRLRDESKQMETALRALLNMSPVKISPQPGEPVYDAYYDPQGLEILVAGGMSDSQSFAALSREIAHARIHDRGNYADYDREECSLDAESVSYVVCRRFGLAAVQPDCGAAPQQYGDYELQERRDLLSSLQKLAERIGNAVDRELNPVDRERQAAAKEEKER